MTSAPKLDNSSLALKISLRRELVRTLEGLGVAPIVVMETHGGYGLLWARCYPELEEGVVFERNEQRADALARARPTWAVYEVDCERALAAGVGGHLEVNLVDVDPYGNPWGALRAFFGSERPRAPILGVAVNDGALQKVRLGGSWDMQDLRPIVERWGDARVRADYLGACRELLKIYAGQAGYSRLTRWTAYRCGHIKGLAHYAAVLERGD